MALDPLQRYLLHPQLLENIPSELKDYGWLVIEDSLDISFEERLGYQDPTARCSSEYTGHPTLWGFSPKGRHLTAAHLYWRSEGSPRHDRAGCTNPAGRQMDGRLVWGPGSLPVAAGVDDKVGRWNGMPWIAIIPFIG